MKNKILQLLLVIILCIVSIFATYCYTMEKNIIKLDDFYGTYSLVEAQNVYNGQYLAIVPCEDNNSNKGSFIIYNTKLNNELSLKTDDGLGSDLQIYEVSENLNDLIENDLIENISEIPGVEAVYAVSYTLGEVFFEKQQVLWDSYIPELANDPSWMPDKVIMEKYNGLGLRDDNGDYRLKTNVYGYDKKMIDALEEYVIEGNINFSSLKQDNSVILKTWVDGQGNTTGIDVHPGDTISLKVPKADCNDTEILRFLGDESGDDGDKIRVWSASASTVIHHPIPSFTISASDRSPPR